MPYISSKSQELLVKKLDLLRARGLDAALMSKLNLQFSVEFAFNLAATNGSKISLKDSYKIASSIPTHASFQEQEEFLQIRKALDEIISSALKDQILEQHLVDKVSMMLSCKPCKIAKTLSWLRAHDRLEHPVDLCVNFINLALAESEDTSRIMPLLINHILLKAKLPLAIVLYNDRKRYQRIVKQKLNKELAEFIAQTVLRSIEIHLEASDQDGCQRQHLSLQELSKGSKYSEAYLRKLALSGKLEAYKIGRNWMSTREALENYQSGKRKAARS